jgi:hypothetical protein
MLHYVGQPKGYKRKYVIMKTLGKKTFRNKKGAVILYCQTDESPETKSKPIKNQKIQS